MDSTLERDLRTRILASVQRRADANGGYLTRAELEALPIGGGDEVRAIDRTRGIWNPTSLEATLSIVSSPDGPYEDRSVVDGLFHYSYERPRSGAPPGGGSNIKLRRARELDLPLLLLFKQVTGTDVVYVPVQPVYVVGEDTQRGEFVLALDEPTRDVAASLGGSIPKQYAERLVRQRLHQPAFRARVIHAYAQSCTVCTLKHPELLDAAHIVADREIEGITAVTNGMAMCKIHHAAYDQNLLGVTPDFEIRINERLLAETDGPMLRHGLQEMHEKRLVLPRRRADLPDKKALEVRFENFLGAT